MSSSPEQARIFVRVRGRGLAVSRRRRRAYGDCRGSDRFLASVGLRLESQCYQHQKPYASRHNYQVASTQLETQTIPKQHEPTPRGSSRQFKGLGGNLTKLWRCRPGSAFLWQPRNVMRKREAAVLKGDDQRGGLGYDAHAHRNGCAKFVVKVSRGLGHLHHFWRWHFPVASAQPPQNYPFLATLLPLNQATNEWLGLGASPAG